MKFITFLCFLIFSSFSLSAQDIITLKDSTNIKVKVLEIGINEIKYKKFNNLDGPFYFISKDVVSKIQFENGTSETMLNRGNELFCNETSLSSIGFGTGLEYSETGFRYQRKLNEGSSFAFRAGLGLLKDFLFTAGVKYYFFKDVYVDLGGGLVVLNYYNKIYIKNIEVYSANLATGADLNLSKRVSFNANLGLGTYYFNNIQIIWGFGFFYKL